MTYALNLVDDGRVLSVTRPEFAPKDAPTCEELPEGDVSDYVYQDGVFVYAPEAAVYPTVTADVEAGQIFEVGGDLYRATMPIPRGEPVNRYNSEPVSTVELLNALQAQKGE